MSEDAAAPEPGPVPDPPKFSQIEEWNANLNKVKHFAHEHQRWPSTVAETEDEKVLGLWWSRQRYNFAKKETGGKAGLSDERASKIRAALGMFGMFELDGKWDVRHRLVQNRIRSHSKLWPYKTANEEDQKNLRWWNQQKTFYRKFRKGEPNSGGMTEERAIKVESILRLIGETIIPRNPNLGK